MDKVKLNLFVSSESFCLTLSLTPVVGLLLLIGRYCMYVVVQSDELLHKELDEAGTAAPGLQSTCKCLDVNYMSHNSHVQVSPSDVCTHLLFLILQTNPS